MSEIALDGKQLEAVQLCTDVTKRLVAVTGPAGTGKTTVLRKIYNDLCAAGYSVGLCSPTGKAAKRIYEVTGIDAQTIHRLLEFTHPGEPNPKTGKPDGMSLPRRHEQNPVELDFILADEYAMVNDGVHRALMAAVKPGGCVRVFGDINQLAPIEEDKSLQGRPSPFQQMLSNDKIPSVLLERVYRQGADSGILLNAHSILKSRMPTKNDQWDQVITDKPTQVLRELIEKKRNEGVDFSTTENQIIVPQRKSWVGSDKLNKMIQGMFHNEREPSLKLDRHKWHIKDDDSDSHFLRVFLGDKVIVTSNMHDLGVFNGETGIVIEINHDTGELVIDFGDREQSFPPVLMVMNRYNQMVSIDPRKDIELAYVITTHKSQGSQYRNVVYVMNKSNLWMIDRKNFYTAITRAQDKVYLIADQKGLSSGVYKK